MKKPSNSVGNKEEKLAKSIDNKFFNLVKIIKRKIDNYWKRKVINKRSSNSISHQRKNLTLYN